MRFMDQWNHRPTPFVWTAWAQDILAKVERCWSRIAVLALASAFATGLRGAQQASAIDANTQAAALEAWRDPALNKKIDDGIEKYRKGDAVLEVVDVGGKPVSGATVRLKQTGHEFLFGSNTFVLGQLKPDEKERRFEEAFLRLFNFTTVPFYWAATEPEQGKLRYAEPAPEIWRRPPPDRFVAWAGKHGILLKGHPLLWHLHNPSWLPKDPDVLRELYRKRFREIAARYAAKIPIWDAVNESLVCPATYPLYSEDRAYVGWAFHEAASLFPKETMLMINEVTSYNYPPQVADYFAQIQRLLAQGARIGAIGLQYHYFRRRELDKFLASPDNNPGRLLESYQKLGEFGLPLYITEITIPSAGEGGAALQEELVRAHYRLWFSVPGMAGITWWNLGDGTALASEQEAQGGLLDADLNPKPAYRALDQLINRDWTTRAETHTDTAGRSALRGFFGTYQVEIQVGGKVQRFEFKHFRSADATHRITLD